MLMMDDRNGFGEAATDAGASLIGGFLMLDRKSFDEAGGVGEADLV